MLQLVREIAIVPRNSQFIIFSKFAIHGHKRNKKFLEGLSYWKHQLPELVLLLDLLASSMYEASISHIQSDKGPAIYDSKV